MESWEKILTVLECSKTGSLTSELKLACEQPSFRSQCCVGQRSSSSKINWRTCHIAIDYKAALFSWFRYAWCDDCVSFEEASQHAVKLPEKKKCRRAASSEFRPILARKTNCMHDLRVFPYNQGLWSSTRTLRFVRHEFTEWRCPRFRCKCLQTRSRKDYTSQNNRILFNFGLWWLCMIKKLIGIMENRTIKN